MTVLTSGNPSENNSLGNPMRVQPVESSLKIAGDDFTHEFPANSLTVLRLKTR